MGPGGITSVVVRFETQMVATFSVIIIVSLMVSERQEQIISSCIRQF